MHPTPRLVLDTNCLIDLDENRADAPHIRSLIAAARTDRIELAIAAVSASENQPGGAIIHNFQEFQERLDRLLVGHLPQLLPLATWDVGFWDHMLWASDEMEALATNLRAVLFPGEVGPVIAADGRISPRWRNRNCDVMVAWCCIHHDWKQLVTSDANFHAHRTELAHLGLSAVLHPCDAAQLHAR